MTRWEYKRSGWIMWDSNKNPDHDTVEIYLNEMGAEGWELVGFVLSSRTNKLKYTFKRPLPDPAIETYEALRRDDP